jgi:TolB protein
MVFRLKLGIVFVILLSISGCSILALIPANSISVPTFTETSPLPSMPTHELVQTATHTTELTPSGKIVFTCQISGIRYQDQICVINADGTGFTRLTKDDYSAHFYPSMAPDGNSIVYSANLTGVYEIYEMDLQGNTRQLTYGLGTLTSPEISPDGISIAFTLGDGQINSVWVMDRDGSNPRMVFSPGWDPTWSRDDNQILFASRDIQNAIQLFIINLDGTELQQVTQMANLRGRSDWSPDGIWAVTYAGESWGRELFIIPLDGGDPSQLTPSGGNSQGPSISPDGLWVVFTAYYNDLGNDNGCEIYIIRTDGSRLTRLTQNAYCDWQPRWGP